jgi:ABC-type multidrug transport system fused ATPase/permease subunit
MSVVMFCDIDFSEIAFVHRLLSLLLLYLSIVYVLDDPLSAVDAHVGRALMADCIVDTLKKRNKATLLVTHQLQYLEFADKILVLDGEGNQTFYGSYAQLQTSPAVLSSLDMIAESVARAKSIDESSPKSTLRKSRGESLDIPAARKASRSESLGSDPALTSSPRSDAMVKSAVVSPISEGKEETPVKRAHAKYDPEYRAKLRAAQAEQRATAKAGAVRDGEAVGASDVEQGSAANGVVATGVPVAESEAESARRRIVQIEDRELGGMSWEVYWRYVCSGGWVRGLLALLVILLSQGVLMITEYWMRWWASNAFGDQRDIKYILIFAGLVVCCVFIGFYRALGWFHFTLRSASDLHERCLWAVMHSPMSFFVSNPTGRVLNRFSRDQNQVDELLPATIFTFLETAIFCVASIILICITIPWMAILVPFLVGFFVVFRSKYIKSTREIKRIEAVTRSPIYADFSATLDGLTTLRAYQLERRVARLFQTQVDANARVFFSFLLCARWLGFRLDLETAVILAFVCFLAVILRSTVDVGLLGFALVYTMALSGLFQWTVRQSVEVETQMTAVERINAYGKLPAEEGYATSLEDAIRQQRELPVGVASKHTTAGAGKHKYAAVAGSQAHPETVDSSAAVTVTPSGATAKRRGNVVLRDLTVTYRADLDPVLRHINLDIPAGYKVGICGRTGSGKSSTLLALLRLNIIASGDILVDGESLLAMDLQSARSRLSIIPQDPHLFSGTVRFNLDPFSMHTDTQIWAALEDAHIKEHIRQDPLGLSAVVEESGKNFSVGQRQLLSLARAILRESKVVLMDEVTASIDYLTDRLIQETIRTSPALRDSTIITVAHRLRTIADSDLIVVVHAGEVVEMGPPGRLLLDAKNTPNSDSQFTKLVQESNEYDEIFKIATAKLHM